jgi:hypothetical protein
MRHGPYVPIEPKPRWSEKDFHRVVVSCMYLATGACITHAVETYDWIGVAMLVFIFYVSLKENWMDR